MNPTDFGTQGTDYIREQLKLADEFGCLLPARLLGHDLGPAFGFYASIEDKTEFAAGLHRDWRENGKSNDCLAVALARWLSAADQPQRALVLEDAIARWSDPWLDRLRPEEKPAHLDEHLYWIAGSGSTRSRVQGRLSMTSDYPGVGALTRPEVAVDGRQQLDEGDLDSIAAGVVAIVVVAFDAEGYLLAPVEDRLSPMELSCAGEHRVAIVVAPDFSADLEDLAAVSHVWLVKTPENELAAQQLWDDGVGDVGDLETGVTVFNPSATAEESCKDIVGTVEEHHGAQSHDPPLSEVEVHGVELSDDLRREFEAYGFERFDRGESFFAARRRV